MPSQWLKTLSHKAAHVKMLSPLYGYSLGTLSDPLEFSSFPPDLFGGDAGRGRWVASGQLDVNGHRIGINTKNWLINTPYHDTLFFKQLHGFEFLLELKALGGFEGRTIARDITLQWINHFQSYHPTTWTVNLTVSRLVNWLIAYPFAFENAPDDFINALHVAIYRHYNHLKHCLNNEATQTSHDRFIMLWGLIMAQSYCSQLYNKIEYDSYIQLLKGALNDLCNADGVKNNRNLSETLYVAEQCLHLKQAINTKQNIIPSWLSLFIEKQIRTLNILTHSDRDFPQFQRTTILNAKRLEKITKLSGLKVRRTDTQYLESGHTSIRKGRTSILIDHGHYGACMSPMAFEMGYAGYRIITSCGTHALDPMWRESLSNINAHSTLIMNDSNPEWGKGEPSKVSLETLNSATLFCGTHNGYSTQYNIMHTRRLYLAQNGEDLRGEDLIIRDISIEKIPFLIRFHLDHTVKATMVESGSAILLKLPNGMGWIFRCDNVESLTLDDSVTCKDGFKIKKTHQITLSGFIQDLNHQIKWGIKRL